MAEGAVGYVLNKLDAFTREEWRLQREVHEGIEDVRRELHQMTAFLREADANQHRDQQLQAWVTQVREVSYDIEDVLDEYLRLRFHRPGGRLIRILFSVKKLKHRHKIAADIQSMKSRVSKIWESHGRYHLPNRQSQDQASYLSLPPSTPVWHDPRRDALLRPEEDPVGMDKPKAQLLQLLGEIGGGSGVKVVSIVGMGGLGKTTLATKVYNEVKPHFQLCAKINVSQSFDEKGVLKQLIRQACNCKGMNEEERRKVESTMDKDDADRLKEIVLDLLRPKRYLILLDDVWNINAWNTLKIAFPDNPRCGSRILLTTRDRGVAAATGNGNFYEIFPLSSTDSWSLFCKKSFWGNPCPSHLETVSQRIVKRCGGLPLAIVAISGVLALRVTGNIDEWEKIDRSMQAVLESNVGYQTVLNVLSMSYNDLPYYLKNCFLYLSAFPEDYLMKRMTLIRLWVADGFVMHNQNLTCEEVAESYLNELVNRNLIQVAETKDGRLASVRLHDMLREIALEKSKNQEFLEFVDGETASTAWERKIRRLSIQSNRIHDITMDERLSKLRTFVMWEQWDPWSEVSVLSMLWGNCPLLRVLDLGGSSLMKFPNKIVELYHLRYLSLRDTGVDAVPNSIGKLRNLETLDLKGTRVRELPIGISKLQQLRHLLVYRKGFYDIYYDRSGFKAPRGIGGLQFVQKLCLIEMSGEANNEQMIREIGRLTQLRKLGLRSIRGEDGKALCSALNRLTNLRSLHLASAQSGEVTIDLDGVYSPPRYLRTLYLCGPCGSLPQWISTLQNLVVLYLRNTKLKDDPLESLKGMPTLVVLILVECYEGETLCFTAGGFRRLKNLELYQLDGLERVVIEESSLPSLEQLSIGSCGSLKEAPAGMQFLAQLKLYNKRIWQRDCTSLLLQARIPHGTLSG